MFNIKIKYVLAVMLGVSALAGAAVLIGPTRAGEQPQTKEEISDTTDQERMVGNWYIVNDDSLRKGEMWVIYKDRILMYAKHSGLNAHLYLHRLDADKDPKQIDITVTHVNGTRVGVIKGIYALDGDELRMCLAALDKVRPAAFPKKPEPGQVLILERGKWGASPLNAKVQQPAKTEDQKESAKAEQKVLTPAEAIKQQDKEQVTVQFEVAAVNMGWSTGAVPKGSKSTSVWWELKDGNNFTVVLKARAAYQFERLRIDTVNHFTGKVIQVTGRVQGKEPTFYMAVDDLDQLEVVR